MMSVAVLEIEYQENTFEIYRGKVQTQILAEIK